MAKKRVAGEGNFEKGEGGEALITKLDDNRARVDFVESGKSYNIQVVVGNVYEDEKASMPEHFPFKAMAVNKSLKVRATLDKEGQRVLFVSPYSGEYRVKFTNFAGSTDEQKPAPEEKMGKGNRPYRVFGAILEIVEGRWKGCRLYSRLYANFGKDPEDGMLAVSGSGKGSDNLQDFLDACGVEYTTIPYSENPLPEIEEMAKAAERIFSVMIVGGWVENYVMGLEDDAFAEALAESNAVNEEVNELLKD